MKQKYQPVDYYLIADPSYWPLFGSIGIFCSVLGLVNVLHQNTIGIYLCFVGVLLLAFTLAGWFGAGGTRPVDWSANGTDGGGGGEEGEINELVSAHICVCHSPNLCI